MAAGLPLFSGDSEIDQLFHIFKHLGTPTPAQWASFQRMPEFQPSFPKFRPKVRPAPTHTRARSAPTVERYDHLATPRRAAALALRARAGVVRDCSKPDDVGEGAARGDAPDGSLPPHQRSRRTAAPLLCGRAHAPVYDHPRTAGERRRMNDVTRAVAWPVEARVGCVLVPHGTDHTIRAPTPPRAPTAGWRRGGCGCALLEPPPLSRACPPLRDGLILSVPKGSGCCRREREALLRQRRCAHWWSSRRAAL